MSYLVGKKTKPLKSECPSAVHSLFDLFFCLSPSSPSDSFVPASTGLFFYCEVELFFLNSAVPPSPTCHGTDTRMSAVLVPCFDYTIRDEVPSCHKLSNNLSAKKENNMVKPRLTRSPHKRGWCVAFLSPLHCAISFDIMTKKFETESCLHPLLMTDN